MAESVSLRSVVHEMSEIGGNEVAFINRRTGELTRLAEGRREILESTYPVDELSDGERAARTAWDAGDLLELPTKYDQGEYTVVEQFCETVREGSHRDQLLKAIRGKRAFRDFHALVGKLGLQPGWLGFRERAFEEIATHWLDRHGITWHREPEDSAEAA